MSALNLKSLLAPEGPAALIVKAKLEPVGGDRFQPAGFPEVGHVLYSGPDGAEKVCIVDSPASMANHLETVCMRGPNDPELVPELEGLPYVAACTDSKYSVSGDAITLDEQATHDRLVATTLTEGHRLASDYFLDGIVDAKWTAAAKGKKSAAAGWHGTSFREQLRNEFGITEVQKDKRYWLSPADWWRVYRTIFTYDPNSLVHGVLFAKEQLKISRVLTAYLDAFGAATVRRSGVKFDRLGKTTSGQPIFSVDEETAREIRATFIIDLALLRSYGRNGQGLNDAERRLLLELSLWKIIRLTQRAFRFRSQCHLICTSISAQADAEHGDMPAIDIGAAIRECGFTKGITRVYYPATDLFKVGKDGGEDSTPDVG